MKRSISVLVLLMVAAALPVTAAVAAPAKSGAKGKSITLHLVEKDVAFNFVDNPPRQGNNAAPLMGDQFTFTSDILTRTGARAGIFAATCTVARGGVHGRYLCYGAYSLKGGLISGVAVTDQGNTTHVAITGGTAPTRASRGARSRSRAATTVRSRTS